MKHCPLYKKICDGEACGWWVKDSNLTDGGECAVKMIAKNTRIKVKPLDTRWP